MTTTPIEDRINAMWQNAFAAGAPLPVALQSTDGNALPPISNMPDTSAQIDICSNPEDPSSGWTLDSVAQVSLTAMTISGLDSSTSRGAPAYFPDDTAVSLPMSVSTLSIAGTYTVQQHCTHSGLPNSVRLAQEQTAFTLTLAGVPVDIVCSIGSAGATDPLEVISVLVGAATSLKLTTQESSPPDWLKWMLPSSALDKGGIHTLIVSSLLGVLGNVELRAKIQDALNAPSALASA